MISLPDIRHCPRPDHSRNSRTFGALSEPHLTSAPQNLTCRGRPQTCGYCLEKTNRTYHQFEPSPELAAFIENTNSGLPIRDREGQIQNVDSGNAVRKLSLIALGANTDKRGFTKLTQLANQNIKIWFIFMDIKNAGK